MRESIRRSQRNDSQRGLCSHHALQDVVDSTVTAAGKNRVATSRDRFPRLRASFSGRTRWLGCDFYSRVPQDLRGGFHIGNAPALAAAGKRVVKKRGLAHGHAGLYWKAKPSRFQEDGSLTVELARDI